MAQLMAKYHPLPPSAASLSSSLRDLGYSLETAVADLIDNSISADSTLIQIFCETSRSIPVLAISDDGRGMTEEELVAALRHGATDPRKKRSLKDLGRFGLGLKTASFSQCRRLTVVSSISGSRSAAEWSLDDVERMDDWFISILDQDEIAALPYLDALPATGTMVIWRNLDRLSEDESGRKRDEIVNEKLAVVGRHLALVFHRFIAGELKGRKKLRICINGHEIEPFDPFCRKNDATQVLPSDTVWIDDVPITLQPYILPHHSRLSATEYDYYQDRSDFISNQGAYVYRNGRLMAWGDWFRMVPKGEATKLARVQIDFPNSLDEAWTIDIKKSRARPPHAVRDRLRHIIAKITARSVTVHRGRGQKLFQEVQAPLWERYAGHGGIRFAVNMDHPLIVALRRKLPPDEVDALQILLNSIGSSLPVEMIYSDYSTNPREFGQSAVVELTAMLERLKNLKQALYGDGPVDAKGFLQVAQSTHLFDGHIDIVKTFIQETLL